MRRGMRTSKMGGKFKRPVFDQEHKEFLALNILRFFRFLPPFLLCFPLTCGLPFTSYGNYDIWGYEVVAL